MSIENLAGIFSQSGADQSMGSSLMSAIIGFLAQKMMGGGGGGIGSQISQTNSINAYYLGSRISKKRSL